MKVLIQPYALLNAAGTRVLQGVVVAVEGSASGGWALSEIDLTTLSGVEVYDLAFVPSDAFDGSGLDGIIAVIEPVDPFQDAGQGTTSAD